ncbi:DUF1405 domain-containing protein [Halorarius litoreus]|uniref:DUF1405 domain-containing protein n=1 Tax=Halorarius litoreus TaxID=2962676 RepID=UPI0020CEBE53|nr:DUF1405 domain-containing protein [Halorarius litoreus]
MSVRVGDRLNALAARYAPGGDESVPEPEPLPWYVAPLPDWLEEFGLRLAWVVVLINLAGTAFGFWFYSFQFSVTDPVMWPFVPDSPLATLFIAGSLALWKLDRHSETLAVLAFFGCIKLGAWTPFVLTVFPAEYPSGTLAGLGALGFVWEYGLYAFLVGSHLAMVVQAFLIHRYAGFPVRAVAVALLWYGVNDVVDYFVPIVGEPHHTFLTAELASGGLNHGLPAHDVAAAGAVVLTMLCVFLALATRAWKLK